MKKTLSSILFLIWSVTSYACITCNRPLQQAISNSFTPINIFEIFLPFLVLGIITAFLYVKGNKVDNPPMPSKVPLVCSAIIIGIGIGGFIDGIVFHQILQWHEMLSNKIPPFTLTAKSLNMFWDGIFHAVTLAVTLTGIILLYKQLHRKNVLKSNKLFAGGLLCGWAIFNLVEGLLNHHIFHLHYVKDIGNSQLWNVMFMIVSVLLLVIGVMLIRSVKIKTLKHETW